jgi:hypothetical protein
MQKLAQGQGKGRGKVRGGGSAPAATSILDMRFRGLVGAEAWGLLPLAVQTRFTKLLLPGHSATYRGEVSACSMTAAGWLLAQLCRLIGAPLPLERDTGVAAVVTVTEDGGSAGQVWTRLYARRRGFPQVIHSAKRFAGPTGLEEYLGGGFGIALTVKADGAGIRFISDHYFLKLLGLRIRLPRWLEPGKLRIDHDDLGQSGFAFVLSLRHPLLGEIIHQICHFRDPPDTKMPFGKGDVR